MGGISRQVVYVLAYENKYGGDVSVYATAEGAVAGAAEIARRFWRAEGVPGTPEGLSDADAVSVYFDAMDGREYYSVTAAEVIGSEGGAPADRVRVCSRCGDRLNDTGWMFSPCPGDGGGDGVHAEGSGS